MSENQINLKQQVENYLNGQYVKPDFKTQVDAGWYDWFCKDTSLAPKTDKLYKKILSILKADVNKKIDTEKTYVFFKNNCPACAPLYDSFSICDIESGDVLFWCSPKSTHSNKAELYDAKSPNGFKEPSAIGTWSDIKNYFKN